MLPHTKPFVCPKLIINLLIEGRQERSYPIIQNPVAGKTCNVSSFFQWESHYFRCVFSKKIASGWRLVNFWWFPQWRTSSHQVGVIGRADSKSGWCYRVGPHGWPWLAGKILFTFGFFALDVWPCGKIAQKRTSSLGATSASKHNNTKHFIWS